MNDFHITQNTQFALIGMGKFGRSIASILCENNYEVLCCDRDASVIQDVAQFATHVIQMDVVDESSLDTMGISNFDVVIIGFSEDFEAAVIATMVAKEQGVPFVLVKAQGVRQKKILESIGADRVVIPEKEMGEKLAYHLITNDPMEYIHHSDKFDIIEMSPKPSWLGKTIEKLNLPHTEGVNILAIIRDNDTVTVADTKMDLKQDDKLIVLKLNQ